MKSILFYISVFFLLNADTISISGKFDFFTTDRQGNIYAVQKNHVIKYNSKGELLFKYSTNKYGKIHTIDAFDPYKILVYYPDFNRIIVLDNMLAETTTVLDLSAFDLFQVSNICRSHNNGIWVYDDIQNRLIRFDENLKIQQKTENLNQLLGLEINPKGMVEYNNKLYVNNPSEGILVFDVFGTYIKNIPIKNAESFQVFDEEILYVSEKKLMGYNFKSLEKQNYSFDKEYSNFITLRSEKTGIYFLTPEKIMVLKQ